MTRIRSWNAKLNVNILQLVCIPLRLRIAMQTTAFPNVPRINKIEYASRKIHFIYADWELHSKSNMVVLFILFVRLCKRCHRDEVEQNISWEPNDRIFCLEPVITARHDVFLCSSANFFNLNYSTAMLSESRGKKM